MCIPCRQSGAKLSIREHDSDPTQKTVDMEGSLEQIEHATRLVRQFLAEKVAAMQANQMGPPGTVMPRPVEHRALRGPKLGPLAGRGVVWQD